MKIDSHQHFWRYAPAEYSWISPEMQVLQKDHLPEDLEPILASHGIGGTIAVQARQTEEETNWLLRLSDAYPSILGVVGWVRLVDPQLARTLEDLAAHPKLRGVRHVLQDEPDDRFMLRDDFQRGLEALRPFDLSYDLLILPRHLSTACQLVRRFPDQRFALDHIAKPHIRDGLVQPWADDLRRLAAFPNVYCKVSGLITEAHWQDWAQPELRPYLDIVFDSFGPERIMFGSDWPVCTLAGTYGQVADVVDSYVSGLSESERAAVWGGNAARFYGLG